MKRNTLLPKGPGRYNTNDGLSLWYRIAGRGPALLVPTPGWGASVDMYMKSLTPLEKDFSVVYLDTRGAGRSDAPAKASGFRFHNFLDDIEALRIHLNLDRWLIFAHSAATLQALGYAIEHPRNCRGLFIVCGTMNIEDDEFALDTEARNGMLGTNRGMPRPTSPSRRLTTNSGRAFSVTSFPCTLLAPKLPGRRGIFFPRPRIGKKGTSTTASPPNFLQKSLRKSMSRPPCSSATATSSRRRLKRSASRTACGTRDCS